MSQQYNVAILGATGAVGETILYSSPNVDGRCGY